MGGNSLTPEESTTLAVRTILARIYVLNYTKVILWLKQLKTLLLAMEIINRHLEPDEVH